MPDLVVIVPSRGRPEAARQLVEAFATTCTASTLLVLSVDDTDPTVGDYRAIDGCAVVVGRNKTMVEALNHTVAGYPVADDAELPTDPFAYGFMGDDHRPRTKGWDQEYLEALHDLGTGMVYGDDLLQRENLPTQIAMTADIVRALGWMAPPDLVHMYVDNWWLQLGRRAGCIRYLADVVVEHVHPVAGKVEWDEGHRRVNAPQMYQRDGAMFARLQATELPAAVEKVKALR